MRGTLLAVVLMILAAVMMGCTDSIVPCTTDEDCQWDWGWDDEGDRDADWWEGPQATCSGPHPLDYCNELLSYIPPLEWLPFGIGNWIKLPDCEALYGELPEETKTCDVSYGWW